MFFFKNFKCSNLNVDSPYNKSLNVPRLKREIGKLKPKEIKFINALTYKEFDKQNSVEVSYINKEYNASELDIVITYEMVDVNDNKFVVDIINPTELFHSEFIYRIYTR